MVWHDRCRVKDPFCPRLKYVTSLCDVLDLDSCAQS